MRKHIFAAALTLVSAFPAQASGGLWCDAADANIRLEIKTGVTRGMGGPFFDFQGGIEVLAQGIATEFRKIDLKETLVHSWLDGDEVKLEFYTEQDGSDRVDQFSFTIETEVLPDSEGEYAGTYKIWTYGPPVPGTDDGRLELTGKVTCGAD